MTKKSSNQRVKQKQKRAAKANGRKIMDKLGREQVRLWMRQRNRFIKKDQATKNLDNSHDHGVGVDENVILPQCKGVGDCCRNRPLFLEPSDVLRIINNERVKDHFGILLTTDLYTSDPPILSYEFNEQSGLPICFVNWRDEHNRPGENKVCPFFIEEEGLVDCLLGNDRLTQCCADPVLRVARVSDKQKIDGWKFELSDTPCITCPNKTSTDNVSYTVRDWIKACGMDTRYEESDMFLSFINWLKTSGASLLVKINATAMLFNWHRMSMEVFGSSREEAVVQGPKTVVDVFRSAKVVTDHIMKVGVLNDAEAEEGKDKKNKGN